MESLPEYAKQTWFGLLLTIASIICSLQALLMVLLYLVGILPLIKAIRDPSTNTWLASQMNDCHQRLVSDLVPAGMPLYFLTDLPETPDIAVEVDSEGWLVHRHA